MNTLQTDQVLPTPETENGENIQHLYLMLSSSHK